MATTVPLDAELCATQQPATQVGIISHACLQALQTNSRGRQDVFEGATFSDTHLAGYIKNAPISETSFDATSRVQMKRGVPALEASFGPLSFLQRPPWWRFWAASPFWLSAPALEAILGAALFVSAPALEANWGSCPLSAPALKATFGPPHLVRHSQKGKTRPGPSLQREIGTQALTAQAGARQKPNPRLPSRCPCAGVINHV